LPLLKFQPSYFPVAGAHYPIQRECHSEKQQRCCCCRQLRGSGKVQRHCWWHFM